MIGRFRHRRHTDKALPVVATRTIIDDACVTHYTWDERRRVMTRRAGTRSGQVVGWQRGHTDIRRETNRRTVTS